MKNKFRSMLFIRYSAVFIMACAAGCVNNTTHVGYRNKAIIIINDSGGEDIIRVSDNNGNVVHPCGITVESGEIRGN